MFVAARNIIGVKSGVLNPAIETTWPPDRLSKVSPLGRRLELRHQIVNGAPSIDRIRGERMMASPNSTNFDAS